MDTEAIDLIEQAKALLARAAATIDTITLADDELCLLTVRTEEAGRLLDSLRVSTAGEIAERSRYELGAEGLSYRHGHSRPVHFIESITRVSQAEAARRIQVGSATRSRTALCGEILPPDFAHVAAALREGSIGVDAAAVVTRALTQAARHGADPEHRDAAECDLVYAAAREPAGNVAVMALAWREALDPDGVKPREDVMHERRKFVIGRERANGMTPFHGLAPAAEAATIKAGFTESLAPGASPRFLEADDLERATERVSTPEGDIVDRITDPRTLEQRQFDVFMGLLNAGLQSDGVGGSGVAVMAEIHLSDLASGNGFGYLSGVSEPVSASTIQEMACDAGFQWILVGYDNEILAEGLRQRFFTAAQRKALAVRDGGCVWPGCTAPPARCHAHHVVEWSKGGLTDIDNGVLLCPEHHRMLHNSPFTMKMIKGRPFLLAPPWLDPTREWKSVSRPRLGRLYGRAA